MFIDLTSTYTGDTIETDICVVGAGVAGITFAREFAGKNVQIAILESGGTGITESLRQLNTGKNTGLPYYNLETARERGFGGTSLLWRVDLGDGKEGARLKELDEIDFEKRDWVPGSGWPFNKSHLDPFYERAGSLCKIGSYSSDAGLWEDPELSPSLHFKEGTLDTKIFRFIPKGVFSGEYRNDIEASKNIRTYLNCTVLNINVSENARLVESVTARTPGGKIVTIRAKKFVLCLGGLETPRLLLNSNDVMKSGLGNQSDLVGRYFMEHPHLWSGIYFPSKPDMYDRLLLYRIHYRYGIPILGNLALSDSILRKEKLLNFTASLHHFPHIKVEKAVQSLRGCIRSVKERTLRKNLFRSTRHLLENSQLLASDVTRVIRRKNRDEWFGKFGSAQGFKLNIMAEQTPDPESRVILDHEHDEYGKNKIKLNWKVSASDINSIRRSQKIMDTELRKAGLGQLFIELENDLPPNDMHGGYHLMGTTRMHTDPANGVVNENCRLHSTDNLYISGPSLFPTAGYANPTLTTVALSIRLADHIKKVSESDV